MDQEAVDSQKCQCGDPAIWSEIIERVEYVRRRLSMNKSRFSKGIGMKPQSYNNFIEPQGSKPNIKLLLGTINVYHVNPYWLLDGIGEVFLDSGDGN